jgi:hypothetical protein
VLVIDIHQIIDIPTMLSSFTSQCMQNFTISAHTSFSHSAASSSSMLLFYIKTSMPHATG